MTTAAGPCFQSSPILNYCHCFLSGGKVSRLLFLRLSWLNCPGGGWPKVNQCDIALHIFLLLKQQELMQSGPSLLFVLNLSLLPPFWDSSTLFVHLLKGTRSIQSSLSTSLSQVEEVGSHSLQVGRIEQKLSPIYFTFKTIPFGLPLNESQFFSVQFAAHCPTPCSIS